jgi:hypothetical protein
MNEDKNVYGENHPSEEGKAEKGIREQTAQKEESRSKNDKSTAEDLEQTRQEMSQSGQSGGMGREGTPNPEATQGTWNRPNE